ncbi:hypothetical protein FEE95_12795 [Maribacter algarum]|uniref:Uncharacterized protein n=1 Tax=Maribacter algarum (ex Zhang et al. 2020) TaxID=2578118 RepID=A0A5S3PRH8_9FLAO|nr:hypothetical protein [Maribacter algarum]TMM57356.1 hypothetical protein FEE95_12795 [Maribacter algarum]
MKKLVPLFLIVFILHSCSTDKVDAIEDALDESVELSDDENGSDDDPSDESPSNENPDDFFEDSFDTDGDLIDYVTNNESALPNISSVSGRYRAVLDDNTNNITLHFHEDQGRIDAKPVTFPFEFIARNIGIGTLADSQTAPSPNGNPYLFSGVQVHDIDFNSINSSHVVVGHRGGAEFTIEGKNTVNGSSSVNDIGANTAPEGRADIRIVGTTERELIVYWQTPNLNYSTTEDNWNLYRDTGDLPGATPAYGEEVYVGLITYAYGQTGVPFVGTCDAIQIKD